MCDKKSDKEQKYNDFLNVGSSSAGYEIIQRYGAAAKQHYVAYSGVDNEAGKLCSKGLKQISQGKVNPDHKFQNVRQQAGFSAEVKDVARLNADSIIQGKQHRKVRTDDIGRVNDPLYDTVKVDAKGNIVDGSGAQMKFLGASEKDPSGSGDVARALEKLQSKKFEKYLDKNVKIDVPSDQYEKMMQEADAKIDNLTSQLKNQKKAGNDELVKKLQDKISKLKKIKKNLRKSSVSSKEAVFARLHPELSTALDVAKISHQAGIQAAQTSALISGSISVVKNVVAWCKGEIESEEALLNVAQDTTKTAASGYASGFAGATLKGCMQNAKSANIRGLSKTNVAGAIVSFTISAGQTLNRYFKGEIDGVECLESLGEQGSGSVAAAMFTVVGQMAIPIPIIGGMIGGMLGYALSSATYGILTQSLKEAKLAHEQRVEIERVCEEHIRMIRAYRLEVESLVNEYLVNSMNVFRESFSGIKNALELGDVDWFIESTNAITENFGGKAEFSCMEEFNAKMLAKSTFKL